MNNLIKQHSHFLFIQNINKQIDNLYSSPRDEWFSRILHISKQLLDYQKVTKINIFSQNYEKN